MLKSYLLANPLELTPLSKLAFPHEVERHVDAIWQAAIRQDHGLFDGPIVTVTEFQGSHLTLGCAMYRHLFAARRSQELKQILALRPLAVSGVLASPDGFVFGRRSTSVAEAAGLWELAPSGGVEASAPGELADLGQQILKELREELGINCDQTMVGAPMGFIENSDTGVIDIAMPLWTSLSASEIQAAHNDQGSKEYDDIRIVVDPIAFAREHIDLLNVSRIVLRDFPFDAAVGGMRP